MAYNGYYGNYNSTTPTNDYQRSNYTSHDQQRSESGFGSAYQQTALPSITQPSSSYQGYQPQLYSTAWYGSNTATAGGSHEHAAEALSRLEDYNHSLQPSNSGIAQPNPAVGHMAYGSRVNNAQTSSRIANGQHTQSLPQNDASTSRQGQNSAYSTRHQRPNSVISVISQSARQSPIADTTHLSRPNYINNTSSIAQNQPPRTSTGTVQDFRSNSPYNNASARQRNNNQTNPAAASAGLRHDQHHMRSNNSGTPFGLIRPTQSAQLQDSRQTSNYNTHYQQGNASNTYDGGADQTDPVTVDPSQVYDPWKEQQRKSALEQAEEKRAEARRAEQARKVEEARRVEVSRQVDESGQLEEGPLAPEARTNRAAPAQMRKQQHVGSSAVDTAESVGSNGVETFPNLVAGGNNLEAQMKAMFEKMREFYEKDPQLLAKIWEQERTTHQETAQRSRAPNKASTPVAERKSAKNQSQDTTVSANTSKPLVNQPSPSAHRREPSIVRPQEQLRSVNKQQQQHKPAKPTPAVQAPLQKASKAQTGTIWPSEKKTQLADAAANWLNAVPANSDNKINAVKIREILDTNPSYIELCEAFENLGLKVDRAAFARALLTTMPEVNSAPRQQVQRPPQSPLTPVNTTSHLAKTSRASSALKSVERQTTSPSVNTKPSNVAPLSSARSNSSAIEGGPSTIRAPSVSSTNGLRSQAPVANMLTGRQGSVSALLRRTQPPATKEEAAKKRSFAEIVDLTRQASDSEDELASETAKRSRFAGPSMLPPLHTPIATLSTQPQASETVPDMQKGIQAPQSAKPAQPDENAALYSNLDVVTPLDKKQALRRSTYNPKHIARDVLLATGRHPEMRSLNAHLDSLAAKFKAINATSDLSTLRWDLLDPGQPVIPQPTPVVDRDAEADGEDEAEGGSQRARPQVVIRRQVLDAATGAVSTVEESISAPGSSHRTKNLGPIKKRRGRPSKGPSSGVTSRPYGFGEGTPLQTPAYRSRPPAAHSEPSNPPPTDSTSTPRSSNNSTRTIPHATQSAAPSGYTALRQQLAADGTPLPRRRGRPVGWRKHIHGLDATPADTKASAGTSRLRQAQSNAEPPEPRYPVYQCKWKNCSGKLHNLETLRKHIKMLHGKVPADQKWKCQWEGCKSEITDNASGTPDAERDYFGSQEACMEHVEKEHLTPIAWELGDGPVGGLSDAHESEASEAYLSDAQGCQVTPRVAMPSLTADSAAATPPTAPLSSEPGTKRRGRPPGSGQGTLRDQAIDAQNSLERKKRQTGPGLDRGGSILVNEKRKFGFIDDDDDEGVVVNDEDV